VERIPVLRISTFERYFPGAGGGAGTFFGIKGAIHAGPWVFVSLGSFDKGSREMRISILLIGSRLTIPNSNW